MKKHRIPDNFECISGTLSELQWHKGSEDFVLTKSDKNVAGTAAIGAAALGQVFNAGGLALASGDTGYAMSYFVGKLGDKTVRGRFYEPDFKNGDAMDMVGIRNGDAYDIVAARRPADRMLWFLPSHRRGHAAHKKWAVKWSLILAFVIVPLISLSLGLYAETKLEEFEWIFLLMWVGIGIGVGLITLIISYEMYTKSIGAAYETTGILKTFGYENPELVDLKTISDPVVDALTKETGKYCLPKAFSYRY